MKSRTLANEKTRSFKTRLKRSYLFGWYRPELGEFDTKKRLSSDQRRGDFKIDQLAFFRKHFWYHFNEDNVKGWIPVKHFRKNYCQLNVTDTEDYPEVGPELACVILMCRYVQPKTDVARMIHQYHRIQPQAVNDFFSIVADQVGRFKNVSRKSMRRIRSQIWHQRPVVMALMLHHHIHHVVILGFNRRVFSYLLPLDHRVQMITRKRLIKSWERCDYRAFSC